MSPTTRATIAQCQAPPGESRYAQLKAKITPTPATMNPMKIEGRLATLRTRMLVDSSPPSDCSACIVKILLPELEMRRLLKTAIVVTTEIDHDDVPVPEVGLHVAREPRAEKILIATTVPIVAEPVGVLQHVGDDNEGLSAPVLDLLRSRDQLQRLENRRPLPDLRREALSQRRGERDQEALIEVLRDLPIVFVEVVPTRRRPAQIGDW